ncbi:MAG: hypothetical protein ACFFBE_08055, partial [Promethearchaeota archaeon]
MKRTNYSFLIFSIFFISIFVVSINQYIDISHAQANDETIILSSNFSMRESTEYIDSNTSVSSITIPLPSEKWNITNIQMNISDIKLGKEIKTIEDKGQSFQIIDSKGKLGYGVELNITEPTIIFGVYIYGYVTGTPVLPVYVQIQGYDGGTDAPDENVLGSTLINMSTPGWHLQMFDKEVSLSVPGSYYLVINGSELTFPADKSTYNWLYNGSGSTHNLYTALYDGDWKQDSLGIPFLHKLIQRVNRSFNPEEVNMTAEFNGSSYPILDGPVESTGNLTINEIIAPNNTIFNIAIKNNRSIDLIFNLSYQVGLTNNFLSEAQVELKDNVENRWMLTPEFNEIHENYTVKFNFPASWYNFSIKRNGVDITSNVTISAL